MLEAILYCLNPKNDVDVFKGIKGKTEFSYVIKISALQLMYLPKHAVRGVLVGGLAGAIVGSGISLISGKDFSGALLGGAYGACFLGPSDMFQYYLRGWVYTLGWNKQKKR